jgi:hypothetical protein
MSAWLFGIQGGLDPLDLGIGSLGPKDGPLPSKKMIQHPRHSPSQLLSGEGFGNLPGPKVL